MANITLAGILRDPNGDLAVGDTLRFTHKSSTGETVQTAVSFLTIPPDGQYSVDIEYGLVRIDYKDVTAETYTNLGVVTVNQDNPATSIPELLRATVPATNQEMLEFQTILANCVTAENNAAQSAIDAANSASSVNIVNDLSQAYIFDTVADYQASTIVFPVGKTIHLNDRGADFTVIAGQSGSGYKTIPSTNVSQSIDLNLSVVNKFSSFFGTPLVDCGVALQEAVDSISDYQILNIDISCFKGASTNITNKSNVTITGKGRIEIIGGSFSTDIFNLVGTISNLEISGLTMVGENNAAWSQSAIGNNSGQNISECLFTKNNISGLNIGISLNAESSGTYNKTKVTLNNIKNMVGSSSGQGYGIHLVNCFDCLVHGNTIENASRHSIYQARGVKCNNIISNNTIRNHRSTVASQEFRASISCSRSTGVSILGNKFINGRDCAIEVSHDENDFDGGNVLIQGNTFTNRSNLVPDILIGQQLTPVGFIVNDVSILNNKFHEDVSVSGGGTNITILNGNDITIRGNELRRVNTSGVHSNFVTIGDDSFSSTSDHVKDITVVGNKARADTFDSGSRLVFLNTQASTGTGDVSVHDNDIGRSNQGFDDEWQTIVTPTNPYTKFKFSKSITYNVPSIAVNDAHRNSIALSGCKSTSQITIRPQKSIGIRGLLTTAYTDDININNFVIHVGNLTAGAQDEASQDFIVFVDDTFSATS